MKRTILTVFSVMTMLITIIDLGWASRLYQEEGILPNHSADYVRTLNRFASTDTDAAFYNPAGLSFMKKDGLYVQFSSQTLYAKRIHTQDYYGIYVDGITAAPQPTKNISNPAHYGLPNEYTATVIAPVLPGLDIVWKGKDYAVYFDVAVMQSAPGMTFNEGLAVMDWGIMAPLETVLPGIPGSTYLGLFRDNFAQRTEYYIGGTIGASYKFIKWMSAALGIRYIYAQGNQKITVKYSESLIDIGAVTNYSSFPWKIDVDTNGHGAGFIFGLHFKPIDIIDIGLKYEYYLPMKLKKKTNSFQAPGVVVSSGALNEFLDDYMKLALLMDSASYVPGRMNLDRYNDAGSTVDFQYPQTISLGFSINILKNLRAETSGEITLRPFAQMYDDRQNFFNPGFKVGQCFEWTFVPGFAVSVGWVYNDFGIKESKRNEVDQLLTSHTVGGGFKFEITQWIDLTLGGFYVIYIPEEVYSNEYTDISAATLHLLRKDFDERRFSVSIGLTARIFGEAAPGNYLVSGLASNKEVQ